MPINDFVKTSNIFETGDQRTRQEFERQLAEQQRQLWQAARDPIVARAGLRF